MPVSLDDLLQQALTLSDDSKLFLAEELVASVGTSADDDDVLVARRRAEYLSGSATLVSSEEALRRVRGDLALHQRS